MRTQEKYSYLISWFFPTNNICVEVSITAQSKRSMTKVRTDAIQASSAVNPGAQKRARTDMARASEPAGGREETCQL